MNDNFNPHENPNTNENAQNFNTQNPPPEPPRPGTGDSPVWSVPPQDGQGYRPPYYEEARRAEPPQPPAPPQPVPQQQYSTSGGWQQQTAPSPRREAYQWNFADYEQAKAARPPRKKKGLVVFAIVLASVVVLSLVSFAGVGIASMLAGNSQNGVSDPSSLQSPNAKDPLSGINLQDKPKSVDPALPEGKLSTEQIVEKLEPSIVAITTYLSGGAYSAEGMGSGIVIREDGYIVTNAHVVEGAQGIAVTMSDGTTKYEGRVVGADRQTDLAVVKIDATGLSAATFGNSDQTKVGEKVLAIGNPQSLDFAGSVTQGIVSGLNRSLSAGSSDGRNITNYTDLIQTDAAINPGNSGGALVNEYGQVIGINSAKVIAAGADGMGFAIPSNQAKPIVDDLINHGRVTGRVLLGITVYQIDEVNARLNSLPVGLLVQTTTPESDISKKGVVPGDIITKVNGKTIDAQQVLTEEIKGKKPGDTVELEVYRPGSTRVQKGRFFNVTVKLIEETDATAEAAAPNVPEIPEGYGYDPSNPETQPPANDQPGYDPFDDFFRDFFR